MTLPTIYPGFTTPEMSEVFSPSSLVAAMCRSEAALAVASARNGRFDMAMADEIGKACREPISDPDSILAGTWESGSPVISLLEVIRLRLSDDAAAHLHVGATTQDIVDTSMSMLSREALALIRAGLADMGSTLARHADEERATPTVGRTFLQPAGPTTFGARAATWLNSVTGALVAIDRTDAAIPAQLGGPVGNLASFGERAGAVARDFADEVGLAEAPPWHTNRSTVTAVASTLAEVAGAAGKIATDLVILGQAEVGEVSTRPGGSSSLPGKKNPIDPVHCIAAAFAARSLASSLITGPIHQLERSAGAWHHELFAIPLSFQTTSAAVVALERALTGMELHRERMAANLEGIPDTTTITACNRLIDAALARFNSLV